MTSSKEFIRWKAYLLQEPNLFEPIHYYLANIACTLAKVNMKDPEKISLEDFLIKFAADDGEKKPKGSKQDVEEMKKSFFASLGLNPDGKAPIRKTPKDRKQPITGPTKTPRTPRRDMRGG